MTTPHCPCERFPHEVIIYNSVEYWTDTAWVKGQAPPMWFALIVLWSILTKIISEWRLSYKDIWTTNFLLQSFKGVNRLEEVKADAWIHIICTFTQFKAFEIETYDAFSMNPCPFSKSFFNVVYSVLVILHIWKHINKICEEVTSLLKLLIE